MITFHDGKKLNQFKSRLRGREILPATVERVIDWRPGATNPFVSKSRYTWKRINLSIEIRGDENAAEIEIAKASLARYFNGQFITFDDMPAWRFFVVLDGEPAISDNYRALYQTIDFSLLAYMETADEITAGVAGGVIWAGNTTVEEIPATIEARGADTITVNLGDDTFVISNVGTGTVTIGGGKVLKDGVNHWEHVEMTSFPRLKNGYTTFSKSPTAAFVVVKYRGRLV